MKHWARVILEDVTWAHKDLSERSRSGLYRIVETLERGEVHTYQTDELAQIAVSIEECGTISELSELTWAAATAAGFQNFAIFVINQGSSGSFKSRICTSYNNAWIARYQDKNYQYVDPVLAQAGAQDGYFDYYNSGLSSPLAKAFWDDAEQHRIGRGGMCWVTTRKDKARLGVVFSSGHTEEKTKELVRIHGHDLVMIADLAIQCFCDHSLSNQSNDLILTLDELRFLHILATSSDPQSALNETSSFGSNKALQASIRSKMNAETIFQAVSIATAKGWFDLLPYSSMEVSKAFPGLEGWEISEIEESGT